MAPSTPFPNFTSPHTFPTFFALPEDPPSPEDTPEAKDLPKLSTPYFLLGTIKENMTLSTNPTYILTDATGQNFACLLRLPQSSGGGAPQFDVKGFKKGCTVVVEDAVRSGVKDGKQGHVSTDIDGVKIIPASVERLMEMSIRARSEQVQGEGKSLCQACGKQGEGLLKCRGCESVWYCNKDCQTRGWSEVGHKGECKVFKAVGNLGLGDRGLAHIE